MNKLTKLSAVSAVASLAMGMGMNTAFAADPIKIGVQAPINGTYAAEGQGIETGVKLLVKQQNDEGGLLGRKLEVTVCDDEGKPDKGAICARKMVIEGEIADIGTQHRKEGGR